MSILVLEHSANVNSGRLGRVLRDHGHRLEVIRLHDGEAVPSDVDDIDGIVSCGGEPCAMDDSLPWLASEMSLLRQAHAAGLPIVGICLGSQVVARALGGSVERMTGGIELGWRSVRLTPAGTNDIVHSGVAWRSTQFHWHRDYVARVPAGAVPLASSELCPLQAWSVGHRVYAVQYHPEVDRAMIERWIETSPEDLREADVTPDALLEQTDRFLPSMARIAERLFEAIALLVMPVDRRFAGVTKDLHH